MYEALREKELSSYVCGHALWLSIHRMYKYCEEFYSIHVGPWVLGPDPRLHSDVQQ